MSLASSALTYGKSRLLGWLLGNVVLDKGLLDDGYALERLALYSDSNFGLLRVDPQGDEVFSSFMRNSGWNIRTAIDPA